jgi:hypothetical protein
MVRILTAELVRSFSDTHPAKRKMELKQHCQWAAHAYVTLRFTLQIAGDTAVKGP